MSFHHIMLAASSFEDSRQFYLAALSPLGYKELRFVEGSRSGLGAEGRPVFWIRPLKPENDTVSQGLHIAFVAKSREEVDQFHAAALKAGGKDNGAPGERKLAPGYYAAFVFDTDGNNIEVMHV